MERDFAAHVRITRREVHSLRSLMIKKYRKAAESFLIEGKNLCNEALKTNQPVKLIVYDSARKEEFVPLLNKAAERHITLKTASASTLKQIASTMTPPGITALIAWKSSEFLIEEVETFQRLLILDEMNDPGNMGTLLRTAEWFGIRGILCSDQSIEVANPKVVRGSMGAVFYLKIWENTPLLETLPKLKQRGFTLIGTDVWQDAGNSQEALTSLGTLPKAALILGNEAHGVRREVLDLCHRSVYISGFGNLESLNVAVAGGILMYHFAQSQ